MKKVDKTLNICTTGTWLSSSNVGDNAVFLGIKDSIEKIGKVKFTVFSSYPGRVSDKYQVSSYAPKTGILSIIRSLRNSDALFFTGGTPFYDDKFHMTYFSFLSFVASIFRKKSVVYSISLRDIKSSYSSYLLKYICGNSCYLGAREDDTLKHFYLLSGKGRKVNLLPDPGTQLVPISSQQAKKILEKERMYVHDKTVGICLRGFSSSDEFKKHHFNSKFSSEKLDNFKDTIKNFVEYLVSKKKCNVIFLPMHVYEPDNDKNLAKEIYNELEDNDVKECVRVVKRQYGPREMKGIFGELFALVGVRFHSLVLSSSMHTPLISIGYAKKNRAIMDYVGKSDFHIDLDGLDLRFLKTRFEKIYKNRKKVVDELAKRYKEINKEYNSQLRKVLRVITEGKKNE